ncbi:MAG: DUF882 domain-containing protein [Ancalomicrobiaceae bacterium]|nr:DUF882 domain-containing protein [Ancalomicrobiaceae bacterium]
MSRTSSRRLGETDTHAPSRAATSRSVTPRSGKCGWLAAVSFVAALLLAPVVVAAPALADTRALYIHHTHTGETATIVFKRDGVYDQEGLKKLNYILRDWRKNEVIKMDPALFDLIWEVYRESGTTGPIEVVCGYRTSGTNNMLRSRSRGVAKFSQHTLGKALDFYLPGVNLERLREIGMKEQNGGVGFYPTSGSPFVHMDTGNVRAWPRMSREQLVRLFPNGKTMHLPADGGPLPHYQDAVAEYQHRHSGQTQIAGIGQPDARPGDVVRPAGNIFASLFGGPKRAEEDDEETAAPAPQATVPVKPAVQARIPAAAPAAAPAPKPVIASYAPRLAPHPAEEQPAGPQAAPVVLASLPNPPTARDLPQREPESAPGAIQPRGWTTGPQPASLQPAAQPAAVLPSRFAAKPFAVPLPAEKPLFASVPTPRPKPMTTVASIDPHGSIDDAFSALTGTPRDDISAVILGYAPVSALPDPPAGDPRSVTSVSRDRSTGVRMASLSPGESQAVMPPATLNAGRSLAAAPMPAPAAAPKGDRADPMTRLVSHVSDQIEAGLLDAAGADRARTMSKLQHPDQDSVPQLIVKPAQVLDIGFSAAPIAGSPGRFTGPAVVALAVVPVR